jgi:hypothetical protein
LVESLFNLLGVNKFSEPDWLTGITAKDSLSRIINEKNPINNVYYLVMIYIYTKAYFRYELLIIAIHNTIIQLLFSIQYIHNNTN